MPAFGVGDDVVVKQRVRGGAVSLLWTGYVLAIVVGSVGFMVELLGMRWVCAV